MRLKQRKTVIGTILFVGVTIALGACGGGNSAPPGNAAPSISSVSPPSVIAGSNDFTLVVNGMNFSSSTMVAWNLQEVPTTYVNSHQLTATISATLVASAGFASIDVSTGPRLSNEVQFTINNPAPQITSISPDSAMAGTAPLVLTINGSGFGPGAFVLLDGNPIGVAPTTPTQIQTMIPLSKLATTGSITISVTNQAPTAGPSNQITFTVSPFTSNPAPTLTSALDLTVPAGWPGFQLHVYGTNFVGASVLQWNGVDRPTTVISSTELAGAIPADQLASPGAAQVSVSNPSPGGGGSGTLSIQIQSVSPDATGVIERSNTGTDLAEADLGSSLAAVSSDGRYVAFISWADNLAPNTEFEDNLFLRDTCIRAPTDCVPSVTFISPAQEVRPAISANGRFIAFTSNVGISLYDSCVGAPAGCVPGTRTIDDGSNGEDTQVALSADGRFAVFFSDENDCYSDYSGDPCANSTGQFFLDDTCAGVASSCTPSSQPISKPTATYVEIPDGSGYLGIVHPSISPDGRFIAFNTNDTQLALYDSCQGAGESCSPSTTMISVAGDGRPADGVSYAPSLSSGGRYVAFLSSASNLVAGNVTSGVFRVYLRDMCTAVSSGCTPTTTLIAVAGDGTQLVNDPSISADGKYVAYGSMQADLVPGDTNGVQDIFVLDTCAGVSSGCSPSTVRVSVALDGTQGKTDSFRPMISSDGRFVVFSSAAKLGPGNPSNEDVYLARR